MNLLQTEGLGIQFGGLAALDDLCVQINAGETVGLIGPNGSGKSTFFNLITGIYFPTHGKILLDGQELGGLSPHRIARKGVSRTFQNCRLFSSLTVLDNVLAGVRQLRESTIVDAIFRPGKVKTETGQSIEEATAVMEYFGSELVERKYQRVRDLPLADKRRVEICRAIASRPRLLLLDEPSAGMNPEETSELMRDLFIVRERNPEISIIVIEHDMRVVREIAQRVVVLNYGRKIFEGTFSEASQHPGVKAAYFGVEDDRA